MNGNSSDSVVMPIRLFPLAEGPDKIGRNHQQVDDDADREKSDRRATGIRGGIGRDKLGLGDRRLLHCAGEVAR